MKTYVINPDTQKPVSLEEWAKDADPTRAELLLVDTGEKRMLVRKSFFPGEHNFKDAQEIAAAYKPFPESPFAFRGPTRKESLDLYDARFVGGLGKAVKLTGGNFCCDPDDNCFWTCEMDVDPRYSATNGWLFYGNYGYLTNYNVFSAIRAQAVTLLTTDY